MKTSRLFNLILFLWTALVAPVAQAQVTKMPFQQFVGSTTPSGQTDVFYVNSKLTGTTPPVADMPVNHKFLIYRMRTTLPVQTGANGFRYVDWAGGWATGGWTAIQRRDVLIRDTYNPAVPITDQVLTGNGASGILIPRFEKWILESEGWLPTFLKNAPPFTPSELAIQANKIFGGTMPDGKASISDMHAHGWKYTEERSINGRNLLTSERYQIPSGNQFKYELLGGAPYTGPPIYGPWPTPSYEQGVQAANAYSAFNYPFWIDQLSEAHPEENAVPVIGPGHFGFVARLKELFPNRKVYAGYGENVQFQVPAHGRNYLHPDWVRLWEGDPRYDAQGGLDPFFQIKYNGQSHFSAGINFLNQSYPDDPGDPDFFITNVLKLEVKLRQAYAAGQPLRGKSLLFAWPWLETPGSARHDAVQYDLKTSSVIVRRTAGGIPDIIGQEWTSLQHTLKGDGLLVWADHHNVIDDPNKIHAPFDPSHAQIIPLPGHSASEFQFVAEGQPARPRGPYIGYDFLFIGYRKAVKVMDHLGTDSPAWAHVTYSMGGQTYAPPANGMGLANSAYYCRPIVEMYSNPQNGKKAVVAVDFFCQPWDVKTITVQLGGGKTIDIPLEGNAVHVALIN